MSRVSPLEEAKERLSIPALWERLGLPGEPRRHGRSPFREDRSPSFSIYAEGRRWCDFGTGSGGDAVDFLACALQISLPDAARKLIEMAGLSSPDRSVRSQANDWRLRMPVAGSQAVGKVEGADQSEKAVKRARWPALEPCTEQELAEIANLRGVSVEGVTLASERGLLWMATSQEGRAWVLTDSRRVNAQARRLDGRPWERIGAKAWTLPGSEAAWPLGLPESAAHPAIALVEGGPDLLAAFHLAAQCGVSDLVAPVAMLGAGQAIPKEALPFFGGKGVRIFAQADEAGRQAARRWAGQVSATVRRYDVFAPSEGDLNDFVRREGEDHAAAMAFTDGLPPRRESPEDAESRRIAGELLRMQRAGAIEGPDDPEAPLYAAVIRLFGARFGGRGSFAAMELAA